MKIRNKIILVTLLLSHSIGFAAGGGRNNSNSLSGSSTNHSNSLDQTSSTQGPSNHITRNIDNSGSQSTSYHTHPDEISGEYDYDPDYED